MSKLALLSSIIILVSACSQAPSKDTQNEAAGEVLTYDLVTNDRSQIGRIYLEDAPKGGVKLTIEASNISPGEHGMHFHVKADCSSRDFKSTGGHINIHGHAHGLNNPDGPDNADMPNAVANGLGKIEMIYVNDRVSLGPDEKRANLLDKDGSALILHANPDDGITQPIGGAGARIACAEIR